MTSHSLHLLTKPFNSRRFQEKKDVGKRNILLTVHFHVKLDVVLFNI